MPAITPKLSPEEVAYLEEMKAAGVITKIDHERVVPSIICICGDCDQVHEALNYHRSIVERRGETPRFHLIALNGGPMNLVHRHCENPEALAEIRKFLLNQFRLPIEKKGLRQIEAINHCRCGQVNGVWRYSFRDLFPGTADSTWMLRQMVEEEYRGLNIQVLGRLHIDKGHKKSTHHFCPTAWERHQAEQMAVA